MKQKIVFFGAGPYVTPIIEVLNKKFELSLVITTETNLKSYVLSFCSENSINTENISEFTSHILNKIQSIDAQVAVLASFGLFIPDKVLGMFEKGIINIHPSLLPLYRGPTPVQAAILAGDKTTGVTLIKLDSEIDHGPILVQTEEKIELSDTSETLYRRLFEIGARLIAQVLPKYISGELKPAEQDHSKTTLTEHLSRESGFISIDKPPAKVVSERMIRAYYPWPGVWFKTKLNGVIRSIKLLPEHKIKVEGKNVMKLRDFENGYPEGRRILSELSLS